METNRTKTIGTTVLITRNDDRHPCSERTVKVAGTVTGILFGGARYTVALSDGTTVTVHPMDVA